MVRHLEEFCPSCGSGIGQWRRPGEGGCPKCMPLECARNIIREWVDGPAWPPQDPYAYMARLTAVLG